MPGSRWEESFRVRSCEVDCDDRLQLSALLHHLQEAAHQHATALGVGFAQLAARGQHWVLARARLELARLPAHGESVRLRTWPKRAHKLMSLRDFRLEAGDEELVRATTAWVVLDGETKRPLRLDRLPAIAYLPDEEAVAEVPGKLPACAEAAPVYERTVRVSDIDLHHHVNNARYAEMLVDAYPPEHFARLRLTGVELGFLAECRHGDRLTVCRAEEQGSDRLELRREGKRVLACRLEWEPRGDGPQRDRV